VVGLAAAARAAEKPVVIDLWPGKVPGETGPAREEKLTGQKGSRSLTDVSKPTITVYRPDQAKDTHVAVVIAPGGGYRNLAWDHEGDDVAAWLNGLGVTGVLLKYRVPGREGRERYAAPLQDAQRALGIVRQRAPELGLDPQRIGILGFSAGAHLSAALGANFAQRTYAPVDAADVVSCRPDFAVLVYPGGYLDNQGGLRPEVTPAKGGTPPVFIAMAEDDPVRVENALSYYLALKNAGVPAELHVYPTGGHGYGLRRTADDATTWPDRAADWLKTGGWLKRAR